MAIILVVWGYVVSEVMAMATCLWFSEHTVSVLVEQGACMRGREVMAWGPVVPVSIDYGTYYYEGCVCVDIAPGHWLK